jgi:CRP-like cAMP-binding protein
MSLIDHLLSTKIFEGFTRKEVSEVFPLLGARVLSVKKNAVLIEADALVDAIGVVLSGEFAVSKEDVYGNSNLIKKIVQSEILAAETACTPSQISPVKITCTQDAEIITFPYALLTSAGSLPDKYRCAILKNILDIMANSNMRQLYKIEILSRKSLRDRIVLYLAFQAKRTSGNSFHISLSREEMATYLCVDRSALSRELGRMQKEGLIRFHKNSFHILENLTP